jgi:hypothetical protein
MSADPTLLLESARDPVDETAPRPETPRARRNLPGIAAHVKALWPLSIVAAIILLAICFMLPRWLTLNQFRVYLFQHGPSDLCFVGGPWVQDSGWQLACLVSRSMDPVSEVNLSQKYVHPKISELFRVAAAGLSAPWGHRASTHLWITLIASGIVCALVFWGAWSQPNRPRLAWLLRLLAIVWFCILLVVLYLGYQVWRFFADNRYLENLVQEGRLSAFIPAVSFLLWGLGCAALSSWRRGWRVRTAQE